MGVPRKIIHFRQRFSRFQKPSSHWGYPHDELETPIWFPSNPAIFRSQGPPSPLSAVVAAPGAAVPCARRRPCLVLEGLNDHEEWMIISVMNAGSTNPLSKFIEAEWIMSVMFVGWWMIFCKNQVQSHESEMTGILKVLKRSKLKV